MAYRIGNAVGIEVAARELDEGSATLFVELSGWARLVRHKVVGRYGGRNAHIQPTVSI